MSYIILMSCIILLFCIISCSLARRLRASFSNSCCKGNGYFKILQYLIIGIFIYSK